ncbi:MAG TPA: NAD-dependent epimerase/dehydratase family protein [Myxococcales bacterium]|nr:NAD-dependent epimerase/dehydratase family protein [Myxococcales bacterium]
MSETMLVTGGAGFIGSHLAEKLLALGHRVRVLDNLSQGKREWVPAGAELLEGDIVDPALCRRACAGVSGVFHLAAMSRVAPSIERIDFCTEQNVIGTQNVLVAARDAKVRKVVYSGSSTYYGSQPPPSREDMLPQCLNPYALSKYVGEQYCELFSRLYGLPTVTLRYFNVYGARQPHQGAYALVLGIFLDQKKRGEALTIHGDGAQRRDFVHVRDVVEANLAAFRSAAQGVACNVGSATNHSVKEIADMISPKQVHLPRRAGDAEITLADISRARELLGWQPRIRFEDGLRELVEG